MAKETLRERVVGKKLSELSSDDRGKLFHARMSTGEINAVVAHNKLIDDRTDEGKRKGKLLFPPKKVEKKATK